jgi:ribulose-5-phosphate 4-epimerase/fuculose-1-phosphate aldolase
LEPAGDLREHIAEACRVMAAYGLTENILGHVSARSAPGEILIRCRGPMEAGLAYTVAEDVHAVPLSGSRDLGRWRPPVELPIHTEIIRRQRDVSAVAHSHPPAIVTFSLLNRPLLPLYGAYDIPGARLAARGVPMWPRAALIATDRLAGDMADVLGNGSAVILRGHGLVTVGYGSPAAAVAQAVLTALALDALARHTLALLSAGGSPTAISDDDLATLPDLGAELNIDSMWRHVVRSAGRAAGPGPAARSAQPFAGGAPA